jgi:probable F420-dependent oxidoreductase
LKRLGVTIPLAGTPQHQQQRSLRALVDLGYTDLWSQETDGLDALTPLAVAAASVPELRIGSGIASVFTRGPALLAMSAAALADAAPGRFVLGIGSSSATIVAGWNGMPFDHPYVRVRDTIRFLRRALAGERIDERYEAFSIEGFRLDRVPDRPPPIFVAGLRPGMLELAAREGDGALLSLVTPGDVPRIARLLERAGGGKMELVLRIGVVVGRDLEAARAHCRRLIAGYLSVASYAAQQRWLGRGELLEPMWRAWRSGDRRAALSAVPDELIDELFVLGSAERCRERIQRFVAAGITTPVIALMRWEGDRDQALRDLSPAAER